MSAAVTRAVVAAVGMVLPLGMLFAGPAAHAQECVTSTIVDREGRAREVTVCNSQPGSSLRNPGGDRDDEDEAPGGGPGGTSNCEIVAAVEGVSGEVIPAVYTRTRADGVVETRVFTTCGGGPEWRWVAAGTDPANPVIQVTPEMLIPDAYARVRRQLPTPIPRIAPADLAPDGFAFVQMPAFFWVDQGPGQWEPVSATAALAGLSVTVTATPGELVVNTGDGATLRCASAPAFPEGANPDEFDGCAHTYTDSSAMASNGETFPVTVAIVWSIAWRASNGESGALDALTTTSAVRELPVAEIQAVMVDG